MNARDLKYAYPQREHHKVREKQKPASSAPKKRLGQNISLKSKTRTLTVVSLIGMLAITFVLIIAYGASLKYEINQLGESSSEVHEEINNLQIKIKESENLNYIEDRALNELGMVYPSASQYVYLDKNKESVKDLALKIKVNVYQS